VIGTVGFVLLFLSLGLGTVFLAMRGGPRGAREALHTQSERGRRFSSVVLPIVLLVLGAGFPVWVLVANSEDKDRDGPGGTKLTAGEAEGRELFARNCSTCHVLRAANGVGKVGPNLDQLRPPKNLVLDAIHKGRANGNGAMARDLVVVQDAEDVAEFVSQAVGQGGK
jgi:mono/diheme cytochrome c family protein